MRHLTTTPLIGEVESAPGSERLATVHGNDVQLLPWAAGGSRSLPIVTSELADEGSRRKATAASTDTPEHDIPARIGRK